MSREFPVLVLVFIYTTSMRLVSLYGRLHIQYPELMMLHDDQYDDYDGDDNHAESSCDMVKAAPFVSALDNRTPCYGCTACVSFMGGGGCAMWGSSHLMYLPDLCLCCVQLCHAFQFPGFPH